jgi:hypothetical protein
MLAITKEEGEIAHCDFLSHEIRTSRLLFGRLDGKKVMMEEAWFDMYWTIY